MTSKIVNGIVAKIAICDDPKLLKQWIKNATKAGEHAVVHAARLRLYAVLPSAEPGSLAYDVWVSIHALEELEAEKRGKTIRLQRTRNLIRDVGEQECVERLLLKSTPSAGFAMLVEHGMPELLFEAVLSAIRTPLAVRPSKKRRRACNK